MSNKYMTTTVYLDADDMYAFRHMLIDAQTSLSEWVRVGIRNTIERGSIERGDSDLHGARKAVRQGPSSF